MDPAVAINKRASLSACHKVLGVIGICHCPTHEQINEAYEEFEQKCKSVPPPALSSCSPSYSPAPVHPHLFPGPRLTLTFSSLSVPPLSPCPPYTLLPSVPPSPLSVFCSSELHRALVSGHHFPNCIS